MEMGPGTPKEMWHLDLTSWKCWKWQNFGLHNLGFHFCTEELLAHSALYISSLLINQISCDMDDVGNIVTVRYWKLEIWGFIPLMFLFSVFTKTIRIYHRSRIIIQLILQSFTNTFEHIRKMFVLKKHWVTLVLNEYIFYLCQNHFPIQEHPHGLVL